jgi:hypothetical protein
MKNRKERVGIRLYCNLEYIFSLLSLVDSNISVDW